MENPPMGGQAPIAPRVFSCLRAAKAGGETLFLWSEYLKLNVFAFLQIKNQSICCFTVVHGLTFANTFPFELTLSTAYSLSVALLNILTIFVRFYYICFTGFLTNVQISNN
jgi:hypothetical protein